ncbi:protoporphyrinogen oxidase [Achlya hypogyna]|uniref:Protoporphyrinogen oxidase n=1 Tax=Achlya hypogyna TaxID=1202772 RepID=A0A1V9YGL6_ACHHY|nr:protoporphyrinogen oxidase [Achlya hypogyna]
MKNIVVVGGGISGLSAVHALRKVLPPAVQIHLIEAASRLGGLVGTSRDPKYLFEIGPRGFRPSKNGAEIVSLVEQLSLQDECIESMGHNRFVFTNGKVEQVPGTPLEFLKWSLAPDIVKAVLHELMAPKSTASDESVYDFVARRFSPRIAEALLDPMASGIFAGNIRQLSVRSCFGLLHEKEKQHGSVVRSMLFHSTPPVPTLVDGSLKSPFVEDKSKAMSLSFRNGMQTLIDALTASISSMPNTSVALNTSLSAISMPTADKIRLQLSAPPGGPQALDADHVFSAIPARHLAPALVQSAPVAAAAMASIPFASVAIVTLGFRSNVLPHQGFGHLVPSCEKQRIIGVIYDSCSFPQQQTDDVTRLSVFVGGENHKDVAALSLAQIEAIALEEVRAHLGVSATPEYVASSWYDRAIPQYPVGFHALLDTIEADVAGALPRLTLLGNSFYGVGIADAVHRSTAAAHAFAKTLV